MTVAAKTPTISYQEDGSTLAFPVPWYFLVPTDLVVQRTDPTGKATILTLSTDYSVSGGGSAAGDNGGTVTLVATVAGSTLAIWRQTARVQPIDYATNDSFPSATAEVGLDRDMLIEQEQDRIIDDTAARALLVPEGEAGLVLPALGTRANMFLAFDAAGNPLASTGTGTDSGLRSDLAAASGAGLVGFSDAGTYAHGTVGAKLVGLINPLDAPFNCAGDGVTDDTAGFQAAVNFVASSPISRTLYLPAKVFKLTATITCAKSIRIAGEGVEPFVNNPTGAGPGRGSWLHFAHTGKGLYFTTASGTISGVQLEDFGTYRDQPAIAPGWAPTNHDYDIYLAAVSAELERLMLLNATKGIGCFAGAYNGSYARFSGRRIEGQFMQVGIHLDKQYDLAMIDDFRRWNFWADNSNVHSYTEANCDSLYMERVDNPMVANFFSIAHRAAIRIGQSANDATNPANLPGGTVSKLKATDIDLDVGLYGLWLDNTCVNQVLADITNFAAQSVPLAGSNGVQLESASSRLGFTNFDVRSMNQCAVRAAVGIDNHVEISGRIFVDNWNSGAASYEAFHADNTNSIFLHSMPWASNGHGGPIYGGSSKTAYTAYTEDAAGQFVSVATGANVALPVGAGLVVVCLRDYGGDVSSYVMGGGLCTQLGTTGSRWVAPTTAPAAGKISIAYDGSAAYRIYNNIGATVSVTMAGFRMAEGN
jgi:hypothetical protein